MAIRWPARMVPVPENAEVVVSFTSQEADNALQWLEDSANLPSDRGEVSDPDLEDNRDHDIWPVFYALRTALEKHRLGCDA